MPRQKAALRLWSNVDLVEWSKSRENREYARRLGMDPLFQKMLLVILNQRPINSAPRGFPINDNQTAVELGRLQGYEDCFQVLNIMLNGGIENRKQEPIEETYGADDRTNDTATGSE